MTTTKYLEIDSTYRNRNLWPNPCEFQVLLSQNTTRRNNSSNESYSLSALDPVSLASPTIPSWISNAFKFNSIPSSTIEGTVITGGFGNANSPNTIIFTSYEQLQRVNNYYNHATVTIPSHDTLFVSNVKTSRILSYEYLGNNTGKIIIESDNLQILSEDKITINDPTDLSLNRIFVPNGSFIDNAYVGQYLYNETINEYLLIQSYDSNTGTIYAPGSMIKWNYSNSFIIRKSLPLFVGISSGSSSAILSVESNSIILGLSAIEYKNNILGSFIRIQTGNSELSGKISRIIAYDFVTTNAIISPSLIGNTSNISYEILQFTYDNHSPFVLTNIQQSEQCYIKLVSLTLPNKPMIVGGGGLISKYPYVYVSLLPIDSTITNIISSNNPNSTKALFRASLINDDLLSNSSIVRMIGDHMKQKIRFNVDTNLSFKVYLSNGEIFETIEREYYSPFVPNPECQISALFEIITESSSQQRLQQMLYS